MAVDFLLVPGKIFYIRYRVGPTYYNVRCCYPDQKSGGQYDTMANQQLNGKYNSVFSCLLFVDIGAMDVILSRLLNSKQQIAVV